MEWFARMEMVFNVVKNMEKDDGSGYGATFLLIDAMVKELRSTSYQSIRPRRDSRDLVVAYVNALNTPLSELEDDWNWKHDVFKMQPKTKLLEFVKRIWRIVARIEELNEMVLMDRTESATIKPIMTSYLKHIFGEAFSEFKLLILEQYDPNLDLKEKINTMLDSYPLAGDRGLSVVYSYKLLEGGVFLSDDALLRASVLGWCLEMFYADVISHAQGNQMHDESGGFIFRNHIPKILKYVSPSGFPNLTEFFDEMESVMKSGLVADSVTTYSDISKFSPDLYQQMVEVEHKSYVFYFPVVCAMLARGYTLESCRSKTTILIDMGIYSRVQDEYYEVYGVYGDSRKVSSRISWLIVKALELSNEEQKKILHEHYGKESSADVEKIKALYEELDIHDVFNKYKEVTYQTLRAGVRSMCPYFHMTVQDVVEFFLEKIYKRQK